MIQNCPCIILAGGQGTRLKSVVQDRPKALAPVAGQPFLQHLLESLYAQGARDVILSLHHQAEMIEAFVADWVTRPSDLKIRSVREPRPLGTGGAIRFVVQALKIHSAVFVTNGDTFLTTGFREMTEKIPADFSANAIGLVQVPDASRFGKVECDNSGKILRFQEKVSNAGPGWINSGIYFLQNSTVLQNQQDEFSLEKVVFPQLVEQKTLRGISLDAQFIDIGIPSDYYAFENLFKTFKTQL